MTEKELQKICRMTHSLNRVCEEIRAGDIRVTPTMQRNLAEAAQYGADILQSFRENCEAKLDLAESLEAKSKAPDWVQEELFDQEGKPRTKADSNGNVLQFPNRFSDQPLDGLAEPPESVKTGQFLPFTTVPRECAALIGQAIGEGGGKTKALGAVTDLGGISLKEAQGWWAQLEKCGFVYKEKGSSKRTAQAVPAAEELDEDIPEGPAEGEESADQPETVKQAG